MGDVVNDNVDDQDLDNTPNNDDQDVEDKVVDNNPDNDLDELRKQLSASDRARVAAEERLKNIEREKLDESERIKLELEEERERNKTLAEQVNQRALENAFLMNKTVSFHNPKTALKLLDTEGIKVKDDGTVEGMDEAMKKLAESDPYLVIKVDNDEDQKNGATGPRGQKKTKVTHTREALVRKYPALRK